MSGTESVGVAGVTVAPVSDALTCHSTWPGPSMTVLGTFRLGQ